MDYAVLQGTVPVATMQDYSSEVHAYTRGLGHLTLELSGYDVCHNSEEVIAETGYDSEADTANPTGSVFCAHGAGFIVPWDQVDDYMHLPRQFVPEEETQTPADGRSYEDRRAEFLVRCTGSSLPARPAGNWIRRCSRFMPASLA